MRLSILATFLLALGLLALGLLTLGNLAAGPALADDKKPAKVKPPKRPANLDELGQRLSELAARIELLLAEANKDAEALLVDAYNKYTSAQLKKTRNRTRARDLVAIMLNPKKGHELRLDAMKAIHRGGATRNDPDLALEGSRTKRAQFCRIELLPHLKHENRKSRQHVFDLLNRFWSPNRVRNPKMMAFRVDKSDTWKPAITAWKRYLTKK